MSEERFDLHLRYIVGGTSQWQMDDAVRLLDTEGSELGVFKASQDIFHRTRLLFAELHAWTRRAIGAQQYRDMSSKAGLRVVVALALPKPGNGTE